MSLVKIRLALDAALRALTPAIDTAWEGKNFTPTAKVAYQVVNLLPAEPENPAMGGAFTRERGTYQVTLRYPKGLGSADAAARAELLKATFYRGASFTNDGVTVAIEKTPQVGPAMIDADRYVLPVRIRYFSNI